MLEIQWTGFSKKYYAKKLIDSVNRYSLFSVCFRCLFITKLLSDYVHPLLECAFYLLHQVIEVI
uniref:Uncharacterized protein n=1 Tax=Octopus bimaculoides TaxID=37653 RepID=A0A0L8HZM2_OCTBM